MTRPVPDDDEANNGDGDPADVADVADDVDDDEAEPTGPIIVDTEDVEVPESDPPPGRSWGESLRLAPATWGFVALCVLCSVPVLVWPQAVLPWFVMSYPDWPARWWPILSTALVHVAWWHLGLNVWATLVIGVALEERIGPWRMIGLIVMTSIGATTLTTLFGFSGIGASGVVYGMIGALVVGTWINPQRWGRINNGFVWWALAWLVGGFVVSAIGLFPIGNWAHLGGLLVGMGLGCAWAPETPRARWMAFGGTVLATVVMLALAVVWPGALTYDDDQRAYRAWEAGLAAIEAGDETAAIEHFQAVVALRPADADAAFNLALAYDLKGDVADALRWYRRARSLGSDSPDIARRIADLERYAADLERLAPEDQP